MLELLNQYQRLEIALKLSIGRKKKAEQGGYLGGGVMFSYTVQKGQKVFNKNIDDIIGTEDFALPGKIIEKKLHADHIVSLEKIARMEGFETLTYNQQKEIANFVENFIGLSEAANTSKGSKSFADWYIYKKENIPVNPVFREKMILKEKELEIEIQKIIDEFNRINKKE
ncbi:hypothetical protein [Priestia flexa]|uniref:hypothetical protein n=1 Tax=Priestia flexa TaxID=86664 RepID=UPI00288F9994|nr:hypothetical protein [Priestia flexa]MDT2046701.1 hypothetical protein [Priestia flexa]